MTNSSRSRSDQAQLLKLLARYVQVQYLADHLCPTMQEVEPAVLNPQVSLQGPLP